MAENKTKPTDARVEKQRSLLSKVGKHKMGKGCLYFKRLADLDTSVLEKLVAGSVADVRRRYGSDCHSEEAMQALRIGE